MNLENHMTVCMEYPAKRPYEDEPENAAGRGRNTIQRERRKNNDILFHFRKDGSPMTKLSQLKIDPEFQNPPAAPSS